MLHSVFYSTVFYGLLTMLCQCFFRLHVSFLTSRHQVSYECNPSYFQSYQDTSLSSLRYTYFKLDNPVGTILKDHRVIITAEQQPEVPTSLGQFVSSPTIWMPLIPQIGSDIVPVKPFPSVVKAASALSLLRVLG